MLSNQERIVLMEEKLVIALQPSSLEIIDDSARHAGHAGASTGLGHFLVKIKSDKFNGQPALRRHRMVYQALGSMLQTDIHAINIEALVSDN